ncbi:hypothetical protein WDU94_007280 [Cyamophila willieti]
MKGKKLPPLPPLPGGLHTAKSNKYTNETKFMLKSPPSSSGLAEGGPSAQPTSNTYQSLTNYNSYYKYEKFSSASASDNFVLKDDLGLVDAHVEITNWAPVLSNLGLVITLTVQCLVTITSVLKCYRHVCLCSKTSSLHSVPASSSKDHRYNLPHPDSPANSFCSSNNSKQKLVRHWLGHQTIGSSRTVSTVATAPSPVFICAPAPFYTFLNTKTIRNMSEKDI